MSHESWRTSFQSSEQAARAAYAEVEALRSEVRRLRDVLKVAVRACKDLDDEALAREGRLACGAECAAAIKDLVAEAEPLRAGVEYEYEVWQDGCLQAGGIEANYGSAQSEASHYAMMYAQDGPVEVRIYEKRLLSSAQQPVAPSVDEAVVEAVARAICGACEENPDRKGDARGNEFRWQDYRDVALAAISAFAAAQQPADDDEVVFIDGVGAARSDVKSCRDGVQWIRVGDRVYWPLSDSDAKRLHSACCGNGSFDGPASAPSDAPVGMETIREAFDEISGLCRYLRQGGPATEDLQALSDALDEAVDIATNMLRALGD